MRKSVEFRAILHSVQLEYRGIVVGSVLEYMRHNIHRRKLGAKELADVAGMSRAVFFRWFKAETGTTPHQYLLSLRLQVACRSLADTSQPIEKIAQACGFTDNSHMDNAFQQHLGLNPKDYRSQQNAG